MFLLTFKVRSEHVPILNLTESNSRLAELPLLGRVPVELEDGGQHRVPRLVPGLVAQLPLLVRGMQLGGLTKVAFRSRKRIFGKSVKKA